LCSNTSYLYPTYSRTCVRTQVIYIPLRTCVRTQVIYIPLLQLRENKLITRVDQHISALPCRRLSKCNVSRKNWSRHSSTVVSRNHYCDYSMFVAYRQEHFQDIDHDTNVQSLLSPTCFLTIPWHTRVSVEQALTPNPGKMCRRDGRKTSNKRVIRQQSCTYVSIYVNVCTYVRRYIRTYVSTFHLYTSSNLSLYAHIYLCKYTE